jgi:hypothetical protein
MVIAYACGDAERALLRRERLQSLRSRLAVERAT